MCQSLPHTLPCCFRRSTCVKKPTIRVIILQLVFHLLSFSPPAIQPKKQPQRVRSEMVNASSTAKATPQTIWVTCFVPMKWEMWDPDVKELRDTSGGCDNGTTTTFVMNDGSSFPMTLSNVVENKSVDFTGCMFGGMLKAEGRVKIEVVDESTSRIDYR